MLKEISLNRLSIFIVLLLISCNFALSAQTISVTSGAFPPIDLIKNVFLGDGVEVTSVTYDGTNPAVGFFTNGLNDINIDKGIVMSTGNVINAGTANTSGSTTGATSGTNFTDADLSIITGGTGVLDIARYIIKFKPTSDTLRFKYVFGSEEYPEYTCSPFNDVFGFFISGPGISGPYSNNAINLALIPEPSDPSGLTFTGQPVSINNVHNGNPSNASCTPIFPMYYNDKIGSTSITYDGVLDVFIAQVIVIPCEEYEIKLVIADKGDAAWDSVVFLEAKSFGTGSVRVATVTTSLDGAVAEGCDPGKISFQLPGPTNVNVPIDYKIIGTAINGVDYDFIPDNQFIPIGDSVLILNINSIADGLPEGTEYVAFDIQRDICNRDTFYIFIKDRIISPPILPDSSNICPLDSVELDGTLPIVLPPEQTFINNIETIIADPDTFGGQGIPTFSDILVSGVAPTKLLPNMISKICINVQHNWLDDLDIFLISPGGQFLELTTDNGRDGNNYTNTCFTPKSTQPIDYNNKFGAPAIYTPFTGLFLPEGLWLDLVGNGENPTNGTWRLVLIDDTKSFIGKLLDWSITFRPLYDLSYQWSPDTLTACPTCPITDITSPDSKDFILKVTDTYGCIVSDTSFLNVLEVPAAPDVKCGTTTNTQVDFIWDPVPDAIGYLVSTNGNNWVSPLPGPLIHSITGLSTGQSVTLYVQSTGFCGGKIDTLVCKTADCVTPVANIASIQPVVCFGESNGSIDLDATGANPPFDFSVLATNNASGQFTGLAAGNYQAIISDAFGCNASFNFTITQPDQLISSPLLVDSVQCFGASNGIATSTITGGAGAYNFNWSNGTTDSLATNLANGVSFVTITDGNGCKVISSINILQPLPVSSTTTNVNNLCFGNSIGEITVNPTGGTAPFTYFWDNNASNQNTKTATNLSNGVYFVTITDANACTNVQSASISSPTNLTLNVSGTDVTCFGGSDGTATASPFGGTLPYTYTWSGTNQTTQTVTGIGTGTIYVTVTDGGACIAIDSVTLTSPPKLIGSAQTIDAQCFGAKDGTIQITAFGGSPGYTYFWSDTGLGPANRSDFAAGTYDVTITDSKNCTEIIKGIVVGSPLVANLTIASTDATCFGSENGTATAIVSGGNGGWTYLWDDPLAQDLPTASFLGAGLYDVTVTDSKGCTLTQSVTILQPSEILINPLVTNVNCNGANTGSIVTNASGGTGAFSYNWSPNTIISANASNLIAGTYDLTITDANNCLFFETFIIAEPNPIVINFDIGNVDCNGNFNGEATAIVNGGNAPYTYKWSDPQGQTTVKVTGLSPGIYFITVTDASGCTRQATFDISSPTPILVQLTPFDVTCFGGSNGSIGVTTNGGVTPYTYIWSTGETFGAINNLTAGTYFITVSDAAGCEVVKSTVVNEPIEISITGVITPITCPESTDGTISLAISGGFSPYDVMWSTGETFPALIGKGPGTYTALLKDAKGCVKTASFTIASLQAIDILFSIKDISCKGKADGAITALASGGNGGFQYNWLSSTGPSITNLPPGTYIVTVTDQKSCVYLEAITITEPDSSLSGVVFGVDVECFGETTGQIVFLANGGTPPFMYSVDSINFINNSIEIGLEAGVYNCFIVDANGCSINAGIATINEPPPFTVSLGPDVIIKLRETTSLNAIVTNGVGIINYEWVVYDTSLLSCFNCPNPAVDTFFDATQFKVIVTDENGCSASDIVLITIDKTRKVFVPTGFTPNGDDVNDFVITLGEKDAFVKIFRIFDPWGEMVFEAVDFFVGDPTIRWDGAYKGKAMNPATFVWYMEVTYVDGEEEILKGSTTLLR